MVEEVFDWQNNRVNGRLRNHLLGALRNKARQEEVEAVREVVVIICEAAE